MRALQIRVQLAAEGCALLGDTLYAALYRDRQQPRGPACASSSSSESGVLEQSSVQPQPVAVAVAGVGADGVERAGAASASAGSRVDEGRPWYGVMQEDPLRPLALQACRLELLDPVSPGLGPHVYEACEPWWRHTPD